MVNMWLDDVREPLIGYEWVKNYDEAIKLLSTGAVVKASLDHDLAYEHYFPNRNNNNYKNKTGYDVVLWMKENNIWPSEGCIVHSMNPVGGGRMAEILAEHYGGYPTYYIRPFGK